MNVSEIGSWLTTVATIVMAVAIVMTAVIYHRQLEAMTKARQLESLVVIMKYVEDRQFRKARYFMFEFGEQLHDLFDVPFSWPVRHSIDDRVRELSSGDVGIDDIDLALNALNNVCFLVRHGYAPQEAIDAFMKNSLLHAWDVFEPYAQHRRRRRDTIGEHSNYAVHLEWVVSNIRRHSPERTSQVENTSVQHRP